jgi:hypothetical protein
MSLSGRISARVTMLAETAGVPVRWHNTHELDTAGITGGLLVNEEMLANALVAFHRGMLLPNFYVESVTLSSYAADSEPYNPDNLFARTVMGRGTYGGQQAGSDAVLPLQTCLHIKRAVGTGREGNLLLRGVLTEADITSDPLTGAIHLTGKTAIETALGEKWTALKTSLTGAGADMALLSGTDGAVSRPVLALLVKGVTSKQLRNKRGTAGSQGALGGLFDGLVDQYGSQVVGNIVEYLIASGGSVPLLP